MDVLPLLVGQEKGLFEKEGIDLELISFQSALERDAALQAGRLDGYFGDILNTVLLVQSGEQLKIIATAFHTHPRVPDVRHCGRSGSGITDPAGIQGKDVAISSATVIEYLLDQLLGTRSMSPRDVTKLEIKKIPIRLQMLLSGQVTAALLPEPLLTLAETHGASVVLDDRQLDTALTVLAVNLKNRPAITALIPGFLKAYNAAVDLINENPSAFKATSDRKNPVSHGRKRQIPDTGVPGPRRSGRGGCPCRPGLAAEKRFDQIAHSLRRYGHFRPVDA